MDIPVLDVTRAAVTALPAQATSTGAALLLQENDGNVILEVNNPTGGSLVVSFVPQATVGGATFATTSLTVAAGATGWAGPWPPAVFNNSDGAVVVQAASGLKLRGARV